MKSTYILKLAMIAIMAISITSCSDDDDGDTGEPAVDFTGTFVQRDQMGRPAINTVFTPSSRKDEFNTTLPSAMGAAFQSDFEATLLAVNPGYTTNALGQDATTFTTLVATDVLNVARTGTTTFFDGMNVLTGRTLADDVIDVELLLVFGGPMGTDNPGLTSDNVDSNDKPFLTTFPYLASPF